MQYLLTQEELDAIKGTADVERQVRERVGRIAVAVEQVFRNYGTTGDLARANRMITEVRAAFQAK